MSHEGSSRGWDIAPFYQVLSTDRRLALGSGAVAEVFERERFNSGKLHAQLGNSNSVRSWALEACGRKRVVFQLEAGQRAERLQFIQQDLSTVIGILERREDPATLWKTIPIIAIRSEATVFVRRRIAFGDTPNTKTNRLPRPWPFVGSQPLLQCLGPVDDDRERRLVCRGPVVVAPDDEVLAAVPGIL
jgi:hypothetical protein